MSKKLDAALPNTPAPIDEEAMDYTSPADVAGSGYMVNTIELDASFEVPRLQLLQATSSQVANEQGKFGEWYVDGFGSTNEVVLAPIGYGLSRNYRVTDPNDANRTVIACMSPDNVEHGTALLPEGPGIPCATCKLKDWTPNPKAGQPGQPKNLPPKCKQSLNFTAYSVTHGIPVRVSFSSTGEKAGRLLKTLGGGLGLGNFMVKLTSVKKSGPGRTWAEPVPTVIPPDDTALTTARGMLSLAGPAPAELEG